MRLITAFIIACVIGIGLFWLMQRLVHPRQQLIVDSAAAVVLDRVRIAAEPPAAPPPQVTQKIAPRAAVPAKLASAIALPTIELPTRNLALNTLELPLSLVGRQQSEGLLTGVAQGDALAAFAQGEAGFKGAQLVPLSSARPRYPKSAAQRGIGGWVELIFIVTGRGRVTDVRVLDASPRGLFEDAAVNAMQRWLYEPFYVDGKPVAREATQLFRFDPNQIQQIYLWDD